MHCSMYGSYTIPAILMEKDVLFDIEKHGSSVDRVFPQYCKHIGEVGHVITYFCTVQDEWVKNEWTPAEYITFEPHVSTTRNHFY